MTERASIEAAIAALEAQRSTLGDAVVDAAVAPLRANLDSASRSSAVHAQQLEHVSILFVDIVGSTAMSGQLEPEDIVEIIDAALARFTAAVQEHQGRVLQFTGDGLLAVFGTGQAHEQGAENAVRAGLAIIEQARRMATRIADEHQVRDFDVRAGIDSGQVLLGAGVDAGNSIRGSAVNLAARMEQSAPKGGLRISHNTYRQVHGVFEVSEQAALEVKGVEQPVRSYLVQRLAPGALRAVSRGIEGLETRMVGRDTDLARLQQAFEALYGHIDPSASLASITVVAEAGVGKSRLLHEFEHWTRGRSAPFNLFKGRAYPQTRLQPYGLMRDMFACWLQIADSDSAPVARQKISAGLAPLFEDDGEATVHLLGHLIGLDFSASPHLRGILADPQQIRARAFHAAAQVFRHVGSAAGTPNLLLLDDLHWADDGSLDFIRYLIGVNRDVAMLVVGFARPLLFERRPHWGREDTRASRLELAPLGAAHSRDLAGLLLHKLDEVPAGLRERVTESGDGNPFFMEEIVKMLLDEGAIVATDSGRWRVAAQQLQLARVPTTLAGVLSARLAVLRAEERAALQQASVIGFMFWDQALAALDSRSPDELDRLAGREFVISQSMSAIEGAREFTFAHHLLHQFTYDSLLKRDRRAYHARAAGWLAALAGARGIEYLGATGEHHERAGQLAEAASYYTRAAESAAARDAREAALDYVGRALALVAAQDHSMQWRLVATRERLLAHQDGRVRHDADLDALAALADALDSDANRAEAWLRRASALVDRGEYRQAEGVARQALTCAEAAGETLTAARACGKLAIARRRMGDFAAARRLAQSGLELAHERGDRSTEAALLRSLASILTESGDMIAGQAFDLRGLTIWRETGDRGNEADTLNSLGDGCIRLGDYAAASRYFTECQRLAEKIGRPDMQSVALLNLASVAHLHGDHATAVTHAKAAIEIAIAIGARDLEAAALLPLGLAETALRHDDAARAALMRSRELFERNAGPHLALEPGAGLALLALAHGDASKAMQEIEKIQAHLSAGGRLDGTEEPFRIRLACYRVLLHAGDPRAGQVLSSAHADLQARAQRITDPLARQRFLHDVPHHHAITVAAAGLGPP